MTSTVAYMAINLAALENKKYIAQDHFHVSDLCDKMTPTGEPIGMLAFTTRLPYRIKSFQQIVIPQIKIIN